ncbi:hypothetical protein ZOSMA_106G00710 [Zostera marina]|uniref:Uncharacterized protein n=1 Tax=Zostera marina TaxID=29655 RepID=A0A0K9Q640_ZOSMR|nr:hypothetical protein ZOSMA_106G00710 [Zostera marina]
MSLSQMMLISSWANVHLEHSQSEIQMAEEEEALTYLVAPEVISGEIKEEKLVSNELITNDADIELGEFSSDVQHSQSEIQMVEEKEAATNLVASKISGEIKEEKLVSNDVVASIVNELITNDADINYIEKLRSTETVTMCRVPEEIVGADDNDRAHFKPKVISIGPYHSKNEAFYPMQSLKLQYLNDLLRRSKTKNNKVEKYTKAIENQLVTEKAKYCEFAACGISDAEFLKLLVLDGCFIVEFLLKYAEPFRRRKIATMLGSIRFEKNECPYNMFFDAITMYNGMKEINANFFTEFENMLFYEQINIWLQNNGEGVGDWLDR